MHARKIPVPRGVGAPILGRSSRIGVEMRASRTLGAISATISLHLTGKVLTLTNGWQGNSISR